MEALALAAADGVSQTAPQPMLTHGIAGAYRAGLAAAAAESILRDAGPVQVTEAVAE